MKIFISTLLIFQIFGLFSQQNFINVPSAEVTTKNKLFFQQQINFNELIQSNTTLDYGLGYGFEGGVNILGLNFNNKQKSFLNNDTNDRDPYNPLVMLNGLKQFEINENLSFALGTQFGINFTDNKKNRDAELVYGNLKIHDLFIKKSNFVIGSYYNSKHYGGKGNRFGGWMAMEIPITQNTHILTESILGDNAISFTSIAIVYYPKKNIPLTVGVQIPNTKNNSYSLVFEFTFVP